LELVAVMWKFGGGCSIRSAWLAQTVVVALGSNPANSPLLSRIVISARPYSRWDDGTDFPPVSVAMSCMP
jgi:hypothetical protein